MNMTDDYVIEELDKLVEIHPEPKQLGLDAMQIYLQLKVWGLGGDLPETFPECSEAQVARLCHVGFVLRSLLRVRESVGG